MTIIIRIIATIEIIYMEPTTCVVKRSRILRNGIRTLISYHEFIHLITTCESGLLIIISISFISFSNLSYIIVCKIRWSSFYEVC